MTSSAPRPIKSSEESSTARNQRHQMNFSLAIDRDERHEFSAALSAAVFWPWTIAFLYILLSIALVVGWFILLTLFAAHLFIKYLRRAAIFSSIGGKKSPGAARSVRAKALSRAVFPTRRSDHRERISSSAHRL